MKTVKKLCCILLALCLLAALLPGISAEEAPGVIAQTLAYGEAAVPVFRYTPKDFEFNGNNTPVLIVMSDTAFTEETANDCLNNDGFRAIADKESCSVIFASPCFGAEWSSEDYAVIQLISAFASDTYYPGVDYSSGIANPYGMYCSGRFRHYYFAEGKAVAFAKANLDVPGATYPMPEWYVNDAGGFGAGFFYAEDGFTAENVKAGFENLRHTTRIYLNEGESFLTEYRYWDECGVTETEKTFASEHYGDITYYEYAPNTVDVNSKDKTYPLVVIFHGAGMHARAYAQNSAWPAVAAENGFIVISVSGPYEPDFSAKITDEMTDDTYALICDYIKNHAVDASRVYATGFSMGAARSMALGGKYPHTFAGIAPCDPVLDMFPQPDAVLPTFFLGGQYDFYGIFPSENEWCGPMFEKLAACNGFTYKYDKSIEGLWGTEFDANKEYTPEGQLATMYVHDKVSADGVCYTKFCDVSHMSHNVLPYASTVIWDFLSQFSREKDGKIAVADPCEGYTDIDRSGWYHGAADFVISRGLMNGTSATTFEPNATVSRAMVAMILYRMANCPAAAYKATFTDVPEGKWYTEAVEWCAQNGLAAGKGKGIFDPDGDVTRQELAAFMMRFVQYLEKPAEGRNDLSGFADAAAVPAWAKTYVQWAVDAGLISGKPVNGKLCLDPTGNATRAELATILTRFVQKIIEA